MDMMDNDMESFINKLRIGTHGKGCTCLVVSHNTRSNWPPTCERTRSDTRLRMPHHVHRYEIRYTVCGKGSMARSWDVAVFEALQI